MSTPDSAVAGDAALQSLLGPAGTARHGWRRRTLLAGLLLLAAGATGAWFWFGQRQAAAAPGNTLIAY